MTLPRLFGHILEGYDREKVWIMQLDRMETNAQHFRAFEMRTPAGAVYRWDTSTPLLW